jgi:hypothetical protein
METAERSTGRSADGIAGQDHPELDSTITSTRYSALTQDNRALVDDFMALLLKRQRGKKR